MAAKYAKSNPNAPYTRGAAITPHDTNLIDETDAISVGAAGTVVSLMNGVATTLTLPAGIHKLAITRVTTASTATGLVALYL